MASAAELAKYVKRKTLVSEDGYHVECTVLDARQAYGRLDVLVTPLRGEGQKWVEISRTDLNGRQA